MAGVENPVTLETAFLERDERGLHTIAAYLISRATVLTTPIEALDYTFPDEDAAELGFNLKTPIQQLEGRVAAPSVPGPSDEGAIERAINAPEAYYFQLAELIQAAEESGTTPDILAAVKYGLSAPDGLVRVASLSSGLKVFELDSLTPLARFEWFARRFDSLSDLTRDVFWSLFQAFAAGTPQPLPDTPVQPGPGPQRRSGLILVHGTHFEFNPDPDWYYPATGDLHRYIHPHRNDIYSGDDFFEWEGRWSDRGRAVAAKNFTAWVRYHGLEGCDVVTHSHGGNVVMKAAESGLKLRRVLFLSCPVHWNKYNLLHGNITEAYAARVRFDFVVHADGGAQKFPAEAHLKQERQVGEYFGGHSDTRKSDTWQSDRIENMLM
ncbi:hypothetical protein HW561_10015 [Rhodobacteraceae bacterium B1Z28]|uniref:Alpha/beta hydrolase n=1 Tax=Ruegeria haliotis TaxID=2747601 RepID=A0ABX2PR97_9RHOB|nr:hypothetical protein [Ruegeria haliotis]NVO56122.1 hypothetical protein [Ruegeria haliotis]